MNVAISQVYIKPGISFPFSHLMQRLVSEEVSAVATPSAKFLKKYGEDYCVVINVSADTDLLETKIMGPKAYRKTRDVEYTLFLPFDVIAGAGGCGTAVRFLLDGVSSVFEKAGIDAQALPPKKEMIAERICSDLTMFSGPWPKKRTASSR